MIQLMQPLFKSYTFLTFDSCFFSEEVSSRARQCGAYRFSTGVLTLRATLGEVF